MNNIVILRNLLRAIFLMALQVLVLNRISLGGAEFNYITIFLYPVFLMFLPMTTPVWLVLCIGFFYGYSIDVFSDTMAKHTAACVFSAFIRSGLFRILEPQGGYKASNISPTRRQLGFPWFIRYAALFVFLHVFFFFCVEEFTLVYIVKIMTYTVPSFIISLVFITISSFLFDPSE